MFTVLDCVNGHSWECSRNEAWLWARINDVHGSGIMFSIFAGSSRQPLNSAQVAMYAF